MYVHYPNPKTRVAPAYSGYFPQEEEFDLTAIPLSYDERDLRFLRDFILNMGDYVEELESIAGDTSDDFWQAREHAYRIAATMLEDYFTFQSMSETVH